MKVLILTMIMLFNLQAISFNQNEIEGIWTLQSSSERGFVKFGKDRPENRGEIWKLDFEKRNVTNLSKNSSYGYFIENGLLNIYIKEVKKRKSYSRTKKVKSSVMSLTKRLSGEFSGCYEMKIESNTFTQYRSNKKFIMCKISDKITRVHLESVNRY